ncbi:MAG: hypothetical protein CFE23_15430 [Flavobacterium sp. BFFFF1]|uniref:hypothetical protein n=1 Tax=Flavobacterium sp. BFFFF1 TaxID=2015557 RepID=UPI000BD23D16|nr:hypothetical protein [Flavobacterium sp. BFFFF1]OYU79141.1 MAG: hypothetical protein CFE23_15430 [Flavobacterium sp. BFFFF1]
MIKKITFFLIMFLNIAAHSQNLVYVPNGNVTNSDNQTLTPKLVRDILASNPKALESYNTGRSKKTIGDFLLGLGIGLAAGDLAAGLFSDTHYPTAITFVGLGSVAVAIPIKIGYARKIRSAVDQYNGHPTTERVRTINVIGNPNGIGLRLCLN